MELRGRTAVVTGAAGGIGLALARRCAAAGMRVVLADVEAGPLGEAVRLAIDAVISTWPSPCASRRGTKARTPCSTPHTLTAKTHS